jgi:hypothetical protein
MLDVLEVVDSPAESPKCVATQNEQRPKAPARNSRNQTIRFQEPDGPVLLGPTAVGGIGEVLLQPSNVWMVERHEPQQLWRLWQHLRDLIEEKTKTIEKLGQKYENCKFD